MLKGFRIAVVEDDEFMGSSLTQRLELEGAEVVWLRQIARAIGALRTPPRPIDAVICDIKLPDGTGEELYRRLCETTTPPPFLFVTGHGGIEQAVRLMRAGAADYVTKPFDIAVLLERLSALLAGAEREDEFPTVLGISPAARQVETLLAEAAQRDVPVLILGGPGTAKGVVARRIHELSDRRAAPFVSVNVAREAQPDAALLAPGGALERVGEGTLHLHAPERLEEATLAGVLERVQGGRFAGRLIAAGGPALTVRRAGGGALAELLFRLQPLEIAIPPLGERTEDAVWLMARLFPALNQRRRQPLERIGALAEE
ncbi:MAG: sigma-54-dependent Fis family transcriptional regulator, partial [Alphaproteobacteria bacterium]